MLTPEQLEARKAGIGGSDAAAVAGISQHATQVDVWLKKTGRVTDEAGEPAYWGNVLEAIVAEEFSKRTGLTVHRVNTMLQHESIPFMLANIDRRIVGQKRGLECKTINAFSGAKLDAPLDEHICQVQHYMGVTGYEMFHVAYLVGGQKFVSFEVERDPEMIDMLTGIEREFWGYVERDEMPPIDPEHQRADELIKRVYPGTNGETIAMPDSVVHWHGVLQESKRLAAEYDKTADVARNHIQSIMRDAAVGVLPDGSSYTRKVVKQKGFTVEPTHYVDFRYNKPKEQK